MLPSPSPLGTLVAFGGGHDEALLARLAALLPAPDAPVELITTASRTNPVTTARAYARSLRALGCTRVRHLPINEEHPADAPATLRRLAAASLLLFTGGDQERLTDFLLNTEFLRRLRHRFTTEAGFIVAGTSAGAAALPAHMLVEGYGWRALRKGGIEVLPGLNLLPNLLLDQHFVERGRFGRLTHALLAYPAYLGLGLGEETGVVIRGGQRAEVFGDGVVVVLDGRDQGPSNLSHAAPGGPVSAQNVRLHLLVQGQQVDLDTGVLD